MKLVVIFMAALLGMTLIDVITAHVIAHRGLPHRPVDELTNWGQGRAPVRVLGHCPPGTTQFDVDGIFLECYRGQHND